MLTFGLLGRPARAQAPDKVKVGVFPIISSLPYFVALDLGYFKELNIEPETSTLMGGPPNVAALITNQIEVSAVLVTLEGLNADVKKPGVAMYVAMNGQNATYKMEQFVVRAGLADKVKTLADFKGLKLMSAPGPANINTAKGILAKVGLKDGDYTIDQLDMGQHVNAMKAGTFDGGYTLEPSATIMHNLGVAKTVEAGVIAKYILGDPRRRRLRRRLRLHDRIHQQAARRRQALRRKPGPRRSITSTPIRRRRANISPRTRMTPDNVVNSVPMLGYVMVKDMTPKQIDDLQKFADFGQQIGVVPEKVDVRKYLHPF